jgi:hypothetical protein
MSEFIIYAIFIALFILLAANNIVLRVKKSRLNAKYIQSLTDQVILINKFNTLNDSLDSQKLESTEGFVKFISQSRDWAFDYIEEVQSSIKEFVDDVRPEIEYFDEYGIVGDAYPHYYSMKKISQAYKKIENLLPPDYGKIDE